LLGIFITRGPPNFGRLEPTCVASLGLGLVGAVIGVIADGTKSLIRRARKKAERASAEQEKSRKDKADKERAEREQAEGAKASERKKRTRPWYEVLGVAEDASADVVTRAYRALIAQYHPDKVSGLGEEFQQIAEKRSREINNAYAAFKAARK